VLVVEDELLVAMLIEEYLLDLGYEIVGPVMRLGPAIEIAQVAEIDFGVLDINLAGEQSFPVADVLRQRGIPFIFASGYGSAGLVERFETVAVLQKPFEATQLHRLIIKASE
jgi:CheY-like chemotaxis protein